jgi:hypothetical protein
MLIINKTLLQLVFIKDYNSSLQAKIIKFGESFTVINRL